MSEPVPHVLNDKVVPSGTLIKAPHNVLIPNPQNPRILFDPEPLKDLKENIRLHGVLVPLTIFLLPDQERYGILDGARRHRCVQQLAEEGIEILIPCNVVTPPNPLQSMLYMFNIHNFREAWELMPTALSLQTVIQELKETDTKKLSHLTGLSEPQVERCKLLLTFSEKHRSLSLDPNPKTRIPSNFWIEAYPVLTLVEQHLPALFKETGKDGVLDRLVEKYRNKRIKSVIHFRRVVEAFDVTNEKPDEREKVVTALNNYLADIGLETRAAFDGFIQDSRKVQSAVQACESLVDALKRAKIEHVSEDRERLIATIKDTQSFLSSLLTQLDGSDDPSALRNQEEGEGE